MAEKINCKGCGKEIEVNNNRNNKSRWQTCSCGAQFRVWGRRGKSRPSNPRKITWRLPNKKR